MKKFFINELKCGDALNETFMVRSQENKTTSTGKPYKKLMVQDKTGSLCANIWEDLLPTIADIKPSDIVQISGSRDKYGIKVEAVKIVRDLTGIDLSEYMSNADKAKTEREFAEILSFVESVEDAHFKHLLESFFKEDEKFVESFKEHSAAKTMHQNYMGGLVNHTLHVANICDWLQKQYSGINRDLLITAALLHDIGKVEEISAFPENDYTDVGKMLGHIYIGAEMVAMHCMKIKGFPKMHELELKHCILSHQGKLEFGCPVTPKLPEAEALAHADDYDAKMTNLEESVAMSQNDGWLQSKERKDFRLAVYTEE